MESLLRTRGVAVETPEVATHAIEATRKGGRVGFADHLSAAVGFANGCREVLTYDRMLARGAKVRRLP